MTSMDAVTDAVIDVPQVSGTPINDGFALDFDGTDDYVDCGNVGSGIKSIAFWIRADDVTTRKIMDFDGTDQLEIDGSGDVTATSFPGTTAIYVDGVVATRLTVDT